MSWVVTCEGCGLGFGPDAVEGGRCGGCRAGAAGVNEPSLIVAGSVAAAKIAPGALVPTLEDRLASARAGMSPEGEMVLRAAERLRPSRDRFGPAPEDTRAAGYREPSGICESSVTADKVAPWTIGPGPEAEAGRAGGLRDDAVRATVQALRSAAARAEAEALEIKRALDVRDRDLGAIRAECDRLRRELACARRAPPAVRGELGARGLPMGDAVAAAPAPRCGVCRAALEGAA